MTDKYRASMICTNCDFYGEIEFPKGARVSHSEKTCPNCGCETLKKSKEPQIPIDKYRIPPRVPYPPSPPWGKNEYYWYHPMPNTEPD